MDQFLKRRPYLRQRERGKRLVAQHCHARATRGAKRGVAILTE
jgi:hypothetical protein